MTERDQTKPLDGGVETPRCVCCGRSMSVVRVSEICGLCRAAELRAKSLRIERSVSPLAELRGLTLVALDRAGWPRLALRSGNVVSGDEAWRPWLREANAQEMQEVLEALHTKRARKEEETEWPTPALFE